MKTTLPKVGAGVLAAAVVATVIGLWNAAGLGFGALVDVVQFGLIGWLIWNRVPIHARVDEALDVADETKGRIEAVENHLSGLEPPSRGKHGHGRAA